MQLGSGEDEAAQCFAPGTQQHAAAVNQLACKGPSSSRA
jgi:hypothetical protein